MNCGLLGRKLGHSYSPAIHALLADYEYRLYEKEPEELEAFLLEKLEPFTKVPVDAVVLGCTHYPFLQPVLRRILGRRPEILDGADGVARQLRRQLEAADGLRPEGHAGQVLFRNSDSDPEIGERFRMLLDFPMEV